MFFLPSPETSTRSPRLIKFSMPCSFLNGMTALTSRLPPSNTRSKARRNGPVDRPRNLYIVGFMVVSVTPVSAASLSLGNRRRKALIQEDLPTPEAPVTAILIWPGHSEACRYSGSGNARRSAPASSSSRSTSKSSRLASASCCLLFWSASPRFAPFWTASRATSTAFLARRSRCSSSSEGPGADLGFDRTATIAAVATRDSTMPKPAGPRAIRRRRSRLPRRDPRRRRSVGQWRSAWSHLPVGDKHLGLERQPCTRASGTKAIGCTW
mmetsp:Transcript_119685/g.321274  ORF Transcript_119685/g.321274 Transcript_119685/m.321274 type:complete len:268 (+) Transcript_119685:1158-1961(+)